MHVTDLARAHLAVLPLLNDKSVVFNVGTGRGNSNREIIDAVGRVSNLEVPWQAGPRRAGDPASLVASPARLMEATGWAPEFTDIDRIVETAFNWRKTTRRVMARNLLFPAWWPLPLPCTPPW